MKRIFILILLLISTSIYSQDFLNSYEYGTIFFKDGKTLRGHLKRSSNDEIKYKLLLNDKKKIYDYKTVKKISFDKNKKTLHYKHDKQYVYLLEKKIEGKLDLYFKLGFNPGHMGPNGMMMGGSHYMIYYIGKEDSDAVDELSGNVNSKDFWLYFSKYIADCKYIIEKVKDKKSIKKNFKNKSTRLVDMITYYNSHCE
jgi:hypothetical protein